MRVYSQRERTIYSMALLTHVNTRSESTAIRGYGGRERHKTFTKVPSSPVKYK